MLVMIRTESTVVQDSTLIKYLVIVRHVAQAASVDAPIAMTTVHGIVCRLISSAKSPQSASDVSHSWPGPCRMPTIIASSDSAGAGARSNFVGAG